MCYYTDWTETVLKKKTGKKNQTKYFHIIWNTNIEHLKSLQIDRIDVSSVNFVYANYGL